MSHGVEGNNSYTKVIQGALIKQDAYNTIHDRATHVALLQLKLHCLCLLIHHKR